MSKKIKELGSIILTLSQRIDHLHARINVLRDDMVLNSHFNKQMSVTEGRMSDLEEILYKMLMDKNRAKRSKEILRKLSNVDCYTLEALDRLINIVAESKKGE